MRFSSFFEENFLTDEKISIEKVICKEKDKYFNIILKGEKLLEINAFKKLVSAMHKLASDRDLRKFIIDYSISYNDLRVDDTKLYLDYYHTILTETNVDYDLLSLSNSNVSYTKEAFVIKLSDLSKISDETISKANNLFQKFGLKTLIVKEVIDRQAIIEIKKEIVENEHEEMLRAIETEKEVSQKKKQIAEGQKKGSRHVKPITEAAIEPIKNIPSTLVELDECLNRVGSLSFTIQGHIFNIKSTKLAKAELYEISLYDGTDSILLKKFVRGDSEKETYAALKINDVIRVTGVAKNDTYAREIVLDIVKILYIGVKEEVKREDLALEKRVELHIHTNMSTLDGLTDASDYIKQAVKWGHKSIAFTDHDGAYSYHDIMVAAKGKDIKPIYGVELGLVDEVKFNIAYTNEDIDLRNATYVVFDIETTGFSVTYDRIIQIAARKVLHGQVIETFESFVNPKMPIPKKITEITSITDEMVAEALPIEDVLPKFLSFVDGAILVAQNASFDVGHIYANMERLNIPHKEFPVIDTMQLARNFYHTELKTFNLKSLARFFKVQQEHHHLADDDTRVTTEIFLQMLQTLYKHNIYNYADINNSIYQESAYKHVFPRHVCLLVKNQTGYKNLFKVLSDSLTTHFHNESRLLKSVLDANREGLLVGSACVNGEVFETALNKTEKDLENVMAYYDYIEVQPPQIYACAIHKDSYTDVDYLSMAKDTIKRIIKVADILGKIVVATGDVHYLHKEQKEFRDIYISAPQVGGGLHSLANCHETPLQHFRTTDEMIADFGFLGADLAHKIVVTNSNLIADMVEEVVAFKTGKGALYSPADDEFKDSLNVPSIKDDLIKLVYDRAHRDYGDPLPQFVQDRLNKELKSIIDNGFSPVYYMSYLLVDKSNKDGYVVGSRGSVGSSLVATMMNITEVNPLPPHYYCPNCHFSAFKFTSIEKEKYGLTKEQLALDNILQAAGSGYDLPRHECPCCGKPLKKDGQDIPFETFLGFSGDKIPDIDLNFSGKYQPRAHEYVRTLMGNEHAFRAGTVTTVAENKAFGYVKAHLERKGLTKRQTEISRIAKNIEGVRQSTGQHPGGIVVVPSYKEIYDVTPIQYPADKTDNNWRTTHFDYHQFEENLLKLDILGHDDPTTLRYLFDYVEAHPEEFPFATPQGIPVDDPEVYKMFSETAVLGLKPEDINCQVATYAIPEFGTRFTRQMLIDTLPKNFSDLVKISGLSHGTDVWATNCQDLVLGTTEFGKIPFSEVIGCRDDIMVYLIEHGLEPKMAFDIMEYVRKGKAAKREDPAKWERFVNTMKEKNIPEWYYWSCERIKYMFPKAHAVAYVLMAIRIAWFKVYKPILFYSAFFSIRASQFEPEIMMAGINHINNRITEINQMTKTTVKDEDLLTMYQVAVEMLKRGFKFLPVDINKSHATDFLIEGDSLRLPFVAMQGLGEAVALDIMARRNEKPFSSIADVSKRTRINKTLLEKMTKLNAFKDLKEEDEETELGLFAL